MVQIPPRARIALGLGAVVVVAGALLLQRGNAKLLAEDTTIQGDLTVGRRETMTFKNGARLTVQGNAVIQGTLACADSPVALIVTGTLTIDGTVRCYRQEGAGAAGDQGTALALVVPGNLVISQNARMATLGHVQIVADAADLATTPEAMNRYIAETQQDTGDGPRIGPFLDEAAPRPQRLEDAADVKIESTRPPTTPVATPRRGLLPAAQAQDDDEPEWDIGGTWYSGNAEEPLPEWLDASDLKKYLPRRVKRVIYLFRMGPNGTVTLNGNTIVGPNGLDGEDVSGPCDIDIPATESLADQAAKDGMNVNLKAKVIRVVGAGFTVYLGNGGRGGHATTGTDCEFGKARAGNGGKPGNLKFEARSAFTIDAPFTIHPGKAGDGGNATAFGKKGKDGCPGKAGGKAAAFGGFPPPNHKNLRALNGVQGVQHVRVGSMIGGNGGNATATGSDGGDGTGCGCKGGKGGAAGAAAPKGGSVKLTLAAGAQRAPGAADQPGKDGIANATPGKPGKDGICTEHGGDLTPGTPHPAPYVPTPTPTLGIRRSTDAGRPVYERPSPPPAPPPPPAAVAAPRGFFELLNIDQGYAKGATLPYGSRVHFVVASDGAPDMRTLLPMTIVMTVDGAEVFRATIPNDPVANCRGPDGCSIDGPLVNTAWRGKAIRITATGPNGELLASHSE